MSFFYDDINLGSTVALTIPVGRRADSFTGVRKAHRSGGGPLIGVKYIRYLVLDIQTNKWQGAHKGNLGRTCCDCDLAIALGYYEESRRSRDCSHPVGHARKRNDKRIIRCSEHKRDRATSNLNDNGVPVPTMTNSKLIWSKFAEHGYDLIHIPEVDCLESLATRAPGTMHA